MRTNNSETSESLRGATSDGGPPGRPRVPLSLVDRLARTLEAAAAHEPEEVTKQEAVRRLLPAIRAAQEKGYTLPRIAAVLSEAGLPVTGQTLTSYVKHAAEGSARKKRRRRTAPPKEVTPPANGEPSFASGAEKAAARGMKAAEVGRDDEDTPDKAPVAAGEAPGTTAATEVKDVGEGLLAGAKSNPERTGTSARRRARRSGRA